MRILREREQGIERFAGPHNRRIVRWREVLILKPISLLGEDGVNQTARRNLRWLIMEAPRKFVRLHSSKDVRNIVMILLQSFWSVMNGQFLESSSSKC